MISDILINYIKNAVCRFENEIADMCRKTAEPVFLTKNGEGDLVVMDIETYNRREKMLKLREELLAVEEFFFILCKKVEEKIMEKYIITTLIVWIIISTVLLLFVIVSVSKNKTKQERELEDREQEEFVSSLRKTQ